MHNTHTHIYIYQQWFLNGKYLRYKNSFLIYIYIYIYGKSSIQQEEDSFYQQIGLTFEEETNKIKCYIWGMALYGAETWTLRTAN